MKQVTRAMPNRRRQTGFTLIEISIAVVLISILIALGLKTLGGTRTTSNANAEATELPLIVARIQKNYTTQPSFSGVTLAGLIALKSFPPDRVVSTTAVTNRWGGSVTVAPGTINNANDSVVLTYAAVPQDECVELIPMVSNAVRIIQVGGTTVKADGGNVDLSALGTQCGAASTASIAYTFSK